MDHVLLRAIRLSSGRQKVASQRQNKKNTAKESLLKYTRAVTPLAGIPLRINSDKRIYLDGKPGEGTKAGTAVRELVKSGIHQEQIWHRGLLAHSTVARLIRIMARIPVLLLFLLRNKVKIRVLSLHGLEILVGYWAYKRLFKKNPDIIPVIISDISPQLHMQWSAALSVGLNVMWWQEDYHHYNGFSKENYLPYNCSYAAILNEHGLLSVLRQSPEALVFKRKVTPVINFKSTPAAYKIGLATNALFEGSVEQISLLDGIRQTLGVSEIYFRPHPNARFKNKNVFPDWLHFLSKDQTIDDFAKQVDLVIVGNSAIQLKLLCFGIPVLHIAGLDPLGFDLYGYCMQGLSYGLKNVNDFRIENIRTFYSRPEVTDSLFDYVNVRSVVPELNNITLN